VQKDLSWPAMCNKIHEVSSRNVSRLFRQICILALLLCAVTASQLQYWIRFGTWLWLGESKLMLMKLLGGFPLTDLAGLRFGFRCVPSFHTKLKPGKHSDLNLDLIQSFWLLDWKLWEDFRIGVHSFFGAGRLQQHWSLFAKFIICKTVMLYFFWM